MCAYVVIAIKCLKAMALWIVHLWNKTRKDIILPRKDPFSFFPKLSPSCFQNVSKFILKIELSFPQIQCYTWYISDDDNEEDNNCIFIYTIHFERISDYLILFHLLLSNIAKLTGEVVLALLYWCTERPSDLPQVTQ